MKAEEKNELASRLAEKTTGIQAFGFAGERGLFARFVEKFIVRQSLAMMKDSLT